MPDLRPPRWLARALSSLALTAILAACTTPPPARIVQVSRPEHPIPAGAAQALAQRFPERRIVADSHGPLLDAGVDDVAVVLDGATPGAFTVVVLAPPAAGGGAWRVVGASRPILPGCAQCSVSADLAPHALYVRVIRAVGADFENFTYQFAGAGDGEPLRLVGVTAYVPSRPGDPASHSFSASVDLLTGQRTDSVEESGSDGATTHRERQGSVPLRAPIAFDDFSFTADALDAETRKSAPAPFDPAGTLPAVAVDTLRERFPRMTVQSQASGPLRGEGRDIVAVLVPADRSARTGAADAVVAVLLAQPDGSLRLGDVSGAMAHACPTCDVQVQIARRTLSIETTEVTPTGSVSTDWQFAYRPKDAPLRLVGLRIETSVRGGDDGVARRSTVASANLISGDHIDVTDGVVNGRRRRSEQKSRLQVRAPVLLADFAFDASALGDDVGFDPPVTSAAAKLGGS